MRHPFACLILLGLLCACGPAEPAADLINDALTSGPASQTSRPTPGAEPVPAVSGSDQIRVSPYAAYPTEIITSGCDCSLRIDDGGETEDPFFIFDLTNGEGLLMVNGERLVVRQAGDPEDADQKDRSFIHQAAGWDLTTLLIDEGPAEGSGRAYSGEVMIRNVANGEVTTVRAFGTCGCDGE